MHVFVFNQADDFPEIRGFVEAMDARYGLAVESRSGDFKGGLCAMLERTGALDLDGLGELLTEDAMFEMPFRDGQRLIEGRENIIATMKAAMLPVFTIMRFTVTALYPCEDPAFLVAEYVSDNDTKTGGKYANRYITLMEVRDGRIKLFREHFNPLNRAAAT